MEDNNSKEQVTNLADKKAFNFFKRFYYAIFKLDKYGEFLEEKVKVAVGYMFIILFLVAIIITLVGIANTTKIVNTIASFVNNEFPNFTYSQGILKADTVKEYKNEEIDMYMIIDTSDVSNDKVIEYKDSISNHNYGFLLLSNKFEMVTSGNDMEYYYGDLFKEESNGISKNDLQEVFSENNKWKVVATIFVFSVIATFLSISLVTFLNIFMVFLIGYITAKLVKLPIKNGSVFNIAVYSFTLSILLNLVYSISYYYTSFEIRNFDTIYMIISYIYVISAILIIKQNMINTDMVAHSEKKVTIEDLRKQEEQEEKESEEELDRLEREKKEQKKKRKRKGSINPKDSIEDNEPDGSEI